MKPSKFFIHITFFKVKLASGINIFGKDVFIRKPLTLTYKEHK